jgi:hypothetical protein
MCPDRPCPAASKDAIPSSERPSAAHLKHGHHAPLDPRRNHLLAVLPDEHYARFAPHLERVALPLGKVLYESGGRMSHVYFPTTAIVSLLYVMENGASAEIAVVGN